MEDSVVVESSITEDTDNNKATPEGETIELTEANTTNNQAATTIETVEKPVVISNEEINMEVDGETSHNKEIDISQNNDEVEPMIIDKESTTVIDQGNDAAKAVSEIACVEPEVPTIQSTEVAGDQLIPTTQVDGEEIEKSETISEAEKLKLTEKETNIEHPLTSNNDKPKDVATEVSPNECSDPETPSAQLINDTTKVVPNQIDETDTDPGFEVVNTENQDQDQEDSECNSSDPFSLVKDTSAKTPKPSDIAEIEIGDVSSVADVSIDVDKEDSAECIIADAKDCPIIKPTADPEEDTIAEEPEVPEDLPDESHLPDTYYCAVQNVEYRLRCMVCESLNIVKYNCKFNNVKTYICNDRCLYTLRRNINDDVIVQKYFQPFTYSTDEAEEYKYSRMCAQCANPLKGAVGILAWEAMEFCKESCLYRYQMRVGKLCAHCRTPVTFSQLGKYSVRFGRIIRQFCSGACIEEKKRSIRICAYCQKNVGLKATVVQNKLFCHDICKGKYENLQNPKKPPFLINPDDATCFICKSTKPMEVEFKYYHQSYYFCSQGCMTVFKFVQELDPPPKKCHTCSRYSMQTFLDKYAIHYDGFLHFFCSKTCQNIYVITHRRIIPCVWCKVKKYNFDMAQKSNFLGSTAFFCSIYCYAGMKNSVDMVYSNRKLCHQCNQQNGTYELKLGDGSALNFCSKNCIAVYEHEIKAALVIAAQKAPPATRRNTRGRPKQVIPDRPGPLPIITSVCSLAPNSQNRCAQNVAIKKLLIIQQVELPEQCNVGTSVAPSKSDQGIQMDFDRVSVETQTDDNPEDGIIVIPIPVPIYIPHPVPVWRAPVAVATPFPLTIPVPILIPLTRKTSNNIMKEFDKKSDVKAPSDPFEAELLMMAELVAAEKKEDEPAGVESADDDNGAEEAYSPEPADTSNAFGDDMLQMALVMASDYEEPAVDLEGALTASTIMPSLPTQSVEAVETEDPQQMHQIMEQQNSRGRRRAARQTRQNPSRRGRRSNQISDIPVLPNPEPPQPMEPIEKPDAHMCLKYTFGVNAWKQWVTTKNTDLERSSRRLKLFKTELLQFTSDELNYSLCLFVNEVRKPNGTEYAPDTIYYLCLGIQQYLYENGRIDNIFCDSFYEQFTDCLDEVCKKFAVLYNDSHYIVTRVEEEHLWESKQLGAHSPHVLLSTLMFFNTKHFNLTNVDEHMQLSFSHIMKHWKRNPSQQGLQKLPGSRNVLLRFYPPQSTLDTNSRKKKVYEQQENEDNPLRCPVKLYEFYLLKCPESVKTRNDVFYLLPERSCVPDSPVWYSTMALDRPALEKMLHRVKMVKEINVALLTS